MNNTEVFRQAIERIKAAYAELGYTLGWNFLYSPARTLAHETKLMLVGINPGASQYYLPIESVEAGNGFRADILPFEGRGKVFQQEISCLFQRIVSKMNHVITWEALLDRTLTANFCPFRAANWGALPRRDQAVAFSRQLWRDLFQYLDPAVIVCYGGPAFQYFGEVLQAHGFALRERATEAPTGWGATTYRVHLLNAGSRQLTLVGFPHFARFTVCTRAQCFAQMEAPIRIIAERLMEFPEWLAG